MKDMLASQIRTLPRSIESVVSDLDRQLEAPLRDEFFDAITAGRNALHGQFSKRNQKPIDQEGKTPDKIGKRKEQRFIAPELVNSPAYEVEHVYRFYGECKDTDPTLPEYGVILRTTYLNLPRDGKGKINDEQAFELQMKLMSQGQNEQGGFIFSGTESNGSVLAPKTAVCGLIIDGEIHASDQLDYKVIRKYVRPDTANTGSYKTAAAPLEGSEEA